MTQMQQEDPPERVPPAPACCSRRVAPPLLQPSPARMAAQYEHMKSVRILHLTKVWFMIYIQLLHISINTGNHCCEKWRLQTQPWACILRAY